MLEVSSSRARLVSTKYGELRFGYTVARLDDLARVATRREQWYRALDFDERISIAFSAIAMALYSAEDAPSDNDLIRAGMRELSDIASADLRAHGVNLKDASRGTAPNFARYWLGSGVAPDHAPGIVERMALRQIWSTMPPGYGAALAALAAFDSHEKAAGALGISYAAYKSRIREGRSKFLALWHEGEKPSQIWGLNRSRTRITFKESRRKRKRAANRRAGAAGPRRSTADAPKVWMRMYDEIINSILAGALRKGDHCPSLKEATEKWGISRGSAVTAYQSLAEDGYLTYLPHKGYVVVFQPPARSITDS